MKFSKEIITGLSTVLAIVILVSGVNYLKGNSLLGGDDIYYAYFPNSGGVAPSTSVVVNGVEVGKVLEVWLTGDQDSLKSVKMKFSVQVEDLRIPQDSKIEAGGIDLFSKGLTLHLNSTSTAEFYPLGSTLQGYVSTDITSQVKEYADPISKKLQVVMGSIDKMVTNISAFWDTTATSELEASIKEVKFAIKKFGKAAAEIDDLVASEKVRLSKILSNVQSITENLKTSNEDVQAIIGNVKHVSDQMVTTDFKSVIEDAQKTLKAVSSVLTTAEKGNGTLGKLLNDDTMYNELVKTNKELQFLLNDLQLHPERYIHFSVLGAKTKGVPLTTEEEKKLRKILDTIP